VALAAAYPRGATANVVDFLGQVEAWLAPTIDLIEPWWKVLRSLALHGRRFATWEECCDAVEAATQSWKATAIPSPEGDAHVVTRRIVL
jgi:hypothetical protein